MVLSRKQFDVLVKMAQSDEPVSQRFLKDALGCSLGTVNSTVRELTQLGLINDRKITPQGIKALEPYRVTNAIIMAAGMSSRFVPISIETPKGLLKVKGDILIERQIKQLRKAGIEEIIIVLGYKKELFFYLEEKYNVKIIINPEYNKKNNIETLYIARKYIKNTYICSSDDYFSENVFEKYVYSSYYAAVHVREKSNEWYMIPDRKFNVSRVKKSGEDGYIMLGHAYWSSDFSSEFVKMIETHEQEGDYDQNLWEDLFADNIKKLPPMQIRVYDDGIIHEFDSLDELKEFDDKFVKNSRNMILQNISHALNCDIAEITGFVPIKSGLTNSSFVFEVKDKKYVYRHPGDGTEEIISRNHEKQSLEIARQLDVDPTFICMDAKTGWKISEFVPDVRTPDYGNFEDSKRIIKVLHKLHDKMIDVDWEFLPWQEAGKIEKIINDTDRLASDDFINLKSMVEKCYKLTENDGIEMRFCHCDTYAPNWMISGDRTILIDWEYGGKADPGCDVGGYIMDAMYEVDEAEKFIREYCGKTADEVHVKHYLAYVAIISYYWFVWALYRESCGAVMGQSLHNWYVMAKRYSQYLCRQESKNE